MPRENYELPAVSDFVTMRKEINRVFGSIARRLGTLGEESSIDTVDQSVASGTAPTFDGTNFTLNYGNMYAVNVTRTVTVALVNTYYQILSGFEFGLGHNFSLTTNKALKCAVAGKYLANWSLSLECAAANQEVEGTIMLNSSAQLNASSQTHLTTVNRSVTTAGSMIITLAVNDLVSLCVCNRTAANDLVMEHGNLTLVQVSP